MGKKPVIIEISDSFQTPDLNEPGPEFARHGDKAKLLALMVNVGQAETRSCLPRQLALGRAEELHRQRLSGLNDQQRLNGPQRLSA